MPKPHSASKLKEAWGVLRDFGVWALCAQILGWAGVYRLLLVVGGAVSAMDDRAKIPLQFGELAADDIAEYCSLRPDADPQVIRRRLFEGHQCLIARSEDGEMVANLWFGSGRIKVDFAGCYIEPRSKCMYLYDEFVAEHYRGLGVAGGLETYRNQYFLEQGIVLAIGAVWPGNHISLNRTRKRDYPEVGYVSAWKIFGWTRSRLSLRDNGYPPLIQAAYSSKDASRALPIERLEGAGVKRPA